ncbi:MAG TPA: M48 family metalloprotease [Xanthomonadales bacterium]|nr:M48 family metalloprotease [Xanthomonadales bacterium]
MIGKMKVKSRNKSLAHNAARFALALLVYSASMSSFAQNDRLALPDMGASADTILSSKEEEEYAKALVRQMRAYEVLNEDPLINAYFKDMGYRLVANSDRPDKSFTFVVIDLDVVNAFAAPGGVVALYSGLILAADDENEVAGVVAHEIAHVTQQHIYRAIENAQSMSIPVMLAMVGLILVAGASGDAIQGALMGGQAAMQQGMINFTRQNEAEADRIGIQTLAKAGYDPRGMGEFFEKMNRITRAMGEGPPEYLRTHPVTVSRIAEADSRAQNMPIPPAQDGLNFYLAQARLRALVEDYPSKALEHFEYLKQRADMNEAQGDALDYGIAIALQRQGKYQEARKILLNLMDRGEHLAYEIQLADLDLASGHTAASLDRLAGLYHSFPGNNAISMEYSQALLHDGDVAQATTASVILRQQLLNHEDDPALYALYAQASNQAGDTVRAKEAIAESYYLRGGVHEAVLQLQELVRRDDLDYYERARVTARLNEYQIELAKMGLDDRPIPR